MFVFLQKNYNQTTTKRCDICDLCDIYQLLSAEIGDIYVRRGFLMSLRRPTLYPIELQALQCLSRCNIST